MTDWVFVHVHQSFPNGHRYWAEEGWTVDIEQAKCFETYGAVVSAIWKDTPAPEFGRYTAAPKRSNFTLYLRRVT